MNRLRFVLVIMLLWALVPTAVAQYKPNLVLVIELDTCNKPQLKIKGEKEICRTNEAIYVTNAIAPDTLMTWTATDLGSEQTVYASAAPEARFSTAHLSAAGRYLLTAENASYCNVAQFVLTVKDPPPAPTAAEMDPDNPTVACRNSSILLKAAPASPDYTFVWMPACTTATPSTVMGDEASLSYGNDVCDINVYTYDRQLDCMSEEPYVHHVVPFELANVVLPDSLTVCPGTVIRWTDDNVPLQDEVIYEWRIEDEKQFCASAQGDKHTNSIALLINELLPPHGYSTSFDVTLIRTYCSNTRDERTITITIDDMSDMYPSITSPQNPICQGEQHPLSGSCQGTYFWRVGNDPHVLTGNNPLYTFNQPGIIPVTLTCHPENYVCWNDRYLPHTTTLVTVNPLPPVKALMCDGTSVYTVPELSTSDYSFHWSHTTVNNWQVPVSPITSNYSCIITDLRTGCKITLETECVDCDPLVVEQIGTYDCCTGEAMFHVQEPTGPVQWSIKGGAYETLSYSGNFDEIITVNLQEVGIYVLTAYIDGIPCRAGSVRCKVDFIPDFEFEKNCNEIIIYNHSQYSNSSAMIVFYVNGEPFSFNAGDGIVHYIPESDGTYTFKLYSYDGILTENCTWTVTIENSSNSRITITSENTANLHQTCDNTPIRLTATMAGGHAFVKTRWEFGDASAADTSDNTIKHTFENPRYGDPYTVTLTVIDENGCVSNGTFIIQSNPDKLREPSLQTQPFSQDVCPGSIRTIEYMANGIEPQNSATNTYSWYLMPEMNNSSILGVNNSYTYNTTCTDEYGVYVTNDKFCRAKASVNVPFKNKPIAIILPSKYYYCAGETAELNGKPGDGGNYTYNWTVTKIATVGGTTTATTVTPYDGMTSNPGIITFPVGNEDCTYEVDLTVTNDEMCSSVANQVILTVVGTLPPPVIQISNDEYCIDRDPVKLESLGPVSEIHWSNGDYGPVAYYYYPTVATAYYYDATSGCKSQEAKVTVPAAPDFDALLTGCYKVCPELVSGRLPVYCMLPSSQNFDYKWLYNSLGVAGGSGVYQPLWLPLNGYGTYNLNVTYFRDCEAYSDPLVLEESDECKCDSVSIDLKSEFKCEKDCKLVYTIHVTVCNNSSVTICFSKLNPLFDLTTGNIAITYNTFSPVTLLPGGCTQFDLALSALSLDPMAVAFQLEDENCAECTKDFGIDLTPEVNCTSSVTVGQMTPNGSATNSSTYYYNFHIGLTGVQNVLAVWSTPQQVVNYTYDGSTYYLDGLCSFDSYTLQGSEAACIHALVCYNDELCVYTYCTSAEALLKDMEEYGSGPDDKSARSTAIPSEPRLQPNPTTGEVEVVGTADKVTEVMVMDMNGRQVAVYEQTRRFNAAPLASGFYIVRVKTQPATTDAATKVTYIKLVKK